MRTHYAVQIAPIIFHSMYVIKFNIAYLCNCSASVKSIGTMTCIKRMKQGGVLLQSLLDTEPLQIMKSGILQSGMYDALQTCTIYSMYVCVQACTVIDTYANVWALLFSVFTPVYGSAYEINMNFVSDRLIHTRYL